MHQAFGKKLIFYDYVFSQGYFDNNFRMTVLSKKDILIKNMPISTVQTIVDYANR